MKTLSQDRSEFNLIFLPRELDELDLTAEEFRIYAHLACRSLANKHLISVERIAAHCSIEEDVVRASLKGLEEHGLVRSQVKDGVITGGCL